jgi:hypothetical protein
MDYKASLDTLCKAITVGVFVIFIAIGQKSFKAIENFLDENTTTIRWINR